MATTEKVSIAMGTAALRLARRAAEREGVSLSAFVTDAVQSHLEEQRRREAAEALVASFGIDELPSVEEQQALLDLWAQRPAHRPKRTRRR